MISEAILTPKIYARLQEIASNFSKFSVGGPQTHRRRSIAPSVLGSGLRPLTGPPFPKFLDPPLGHCDGISMRLTTRAKNRLAGALLRRPGNTVSTAFTRWLYAAGQPMRWLFPIRVYGRKDTQTTTLCYSALPI